MKIGVISDTHLRESSALLERAVETYFKDVDLILHAGDLTELEVLGAFSGKEVVAVSGNCDSTGVRDALPQRRLLKAGGFRIGLVHGWGPPFGLQRRVALEMEEADCVVFGHSHWPANECRKGTLYFNPGAFRPGVWSLWRRRIGILTVNRDIRGEVIPLPGTWEMQKDRQA